MYRNTRTIQILMITGIVNKLWNLIETHLHTLLTNSKPIKAIIPFLKLNTQTHVKPNYQIKRKQIQ